MLTVWIVLLCVMSLLLGFSLGTNWLSWLVGRSLPFTVNKVASLWVLQDAAEDAEEGVLYGGDTLTKAVLALKDDRDAI